MHRPDATVSSPPPVTAVGRPGAGAVHAGGRARPVAPAVQLKEVCKRYRGGGGIEGVDLEVLPGEVFAFLGPNGAGKTTTIRLILDLIRPDSGRIAVFGLDPRRDGVAVRRRTGYLPGDLALYERLTARELLTHFAHLRGGPPWAAIAELTERFDLDVDRPLRELSKGNRQKVGLVQALMGNPDLLILDEPTSGLDPLVQQQVHAAVRAAAGDGRSVFLSSHVLSEVGQVADRVAIIREGRIVAIERMSDLRSRTVHVVDVRFTDGVDPQFLTAVPGARVKEWSDHGARREVTGHLDPLVGALARHPLADLTIREPDLEDLFLAFYREDRGNAAPAPHGALAGSPDAVAGDPDA